MSSTSGKASTSPVIVGDVTTGKGDDAPVSEQTVLAWLAVVAALFTPAAHAAWFRAAYVMVRGDAGKSGCKTPVSLKAKGAPVIGTPWVVVCHHGTIARARFGNKPTPAGSAMVGAEQIGRARAEWCEACKTGAPATLSGFATTGAVPAAPAPVKAPRKAPRGGGKGKAPAPVTAAPEAPAPDAPAEPTPGE